MNKIDTLITVLGWEDRFITGNKILLDKYNINNIILIIFTDYLYMRNMQSNKALIEKKANELDIRITYLNLNYSDSVGNWKILNNFFKNNLSQSILINTTTFPRETIWTLLFFLKNNKKRVYYSYFKPKKYNTNWLTKNHKNPRLFLKHSGIFKLNNEITLFIITGFDKNRMQLLIDYYEPQNIVIFNQEGNQFENEKRNNINNIDRSLDIDIVNINNYNVDSSIRIINKKIIEYNDNNIILVSHGPKLSALSTYKCFLLSNMEIALAYVPAKDFSPYYSSGTNEDYIFGELSLNNEL